MNPQLREQSRRTDSGPAAHAALAGCPGDGRGPGRPRA